MTDKRYQLKQEDLDYPIYSDLVDTEDNDKVICTFNNDSGTNKMVILLNEQDEQIQELLSCNHGLAQKRIRMFDRLIQLEKENKQLKEELESFEQINFTDMCDGSQMILYMKKENVGDVE